MQLTYIFWKDSFSAQPICYSAISAKSSNKQLWIRPKIAQLHFVKKENKKVFCCFQCTKLQQFLHDCALWKYWMYFHVISVVKFEMIGLFFIWNLWRIWRNWLLWKHFSYSYQLIEHPILQIPNFNFPNLRCCELYWHVWVYFNINLKLLYGKNTQKVK